MKNKQKIIEEVMNKHGFQYNDGNINALRETVNSSAYLNQLETLLYVAERTLLRAQSGFPRPSKELGELKSIIEKIVNLLNCKGNV